MFKISLNTPTTQQMNAAIEAMQRIESTGGFSFNPDTMEGPGDTGYMVSLPEYERAMPMTAASRIDVAEYFRDSEEPRRITGAFAGGWVDEGRLYLDLSVRVLDRKEASDLGAKYGQKAIYDLANGESIYL